MDHFNFKKINNNIKKGGLLERAKSAAKAMAIGFALMGSADYAQARQPEELEGDKIFAELSLKKLPKENLSIESLRKYFEELVDVLAKNNKYRDAQYQMEGFKYHFEEYVENNKNAENVLIKNLEYLLDRGFNVWAFLFESDLAKFLFSETNDFKGYLEKIPKGMEKDILLSANEVRNLNKWKDLDMSKYSETINFYKNELGLPGPFLLDEIRNFNAVLVAAPNLTVEKIKEIYIDLKASLGGPGKLLYFNYLMINSADGVNLLNILDNQEIRKNVKFLFDNGLDINEVFATGQAKVNNFSFLGILQDVELHKEYIEMTKIYRTKNGRRSFSLVDFKIIFKKIKQSEFFRTNLKMVLDEGINVFEVDRGIVRETNYLYSPDLQKFIQKINQPDTPKEISLNKSHYLVAFSKVYQEEKALANFFLLLDNLKDMDVSLFPIGFMQKEYFQSDLFIQKILKKIQESRQTGGQVVLSAHTWSAVVQSLFTEVTGYTFEEFSRLSAREIILLENKISDPVVVAELRRGTISAYLEIVSNMNNLHNESDERRMKELQDLDANVIYKILSFAGRDAYLSTLQLAYDAKSKLDRDKIQTGMVGQVKRFCIEMYKNLEKAAIEKCGPKNAMYEFFKSIDIETSANVTIFSDFLRSIARANYTSKFLSDLGSIENQKEIFNKFFLNKNFAFDINIIYDLVNSEDANVQQFMVSFFETNLDNFNIDTKNTVTAVLMKYYKDKPEKPEWIKNYLEKYGKYLETNMSFLGEKELWKKEMVGGKELFVNTQISIAYSDMKESRNMLHWDGHLSVKNLLLTNGIKTNFNAKGEWGPMRNISNYWQIENIKTWKQDGHVELVRKLPNGRMMRHVVVLPVDESVQDVKTSGDRAEALLEKFTPQIVHHVGHSYHTRETINLIKNKYHNLLEKPFINLRSCGGEGSFQSLFESGFYKMYGTRGVGTMNVNDPWVFDLTRIIAQHGEVDFIKFKLDFKNGNEFYKGYIWPQDNYVVQLSNLMKAMSGDR